MKNPKQEFEWEGGELITPHNVPDIISEIAFRQNFNTFLILFLLLIATCLAHAVVNEQNRVEGIFELSDQDVQLIYQEFAYKWNNDYCDPTENKSVWIEEEVFLEELGISKEYLISNRVVSGAYFTSIAIGALQYIFGYNGEGNVLVIYEGRYEIDMTLTHIMSGNQQEMQIVTKLPDNTYRLRIWNGINNNWVKDIEIQIPNDFDQNTIGFVYIEPDILVLQENGVNDSLSRSIYVNLQNGNSIVLNGINSVQELGPYFMLIYLANGTELVLKRGDFSLISEGNFKSLFDVTELIMDIDEKNGILRVYSAGNNNALILLLEMPFSPLEIGNKLQDPFTLIALGNNFYLVGTNAASVVNGIIEGTGYPDDMPAPLFLVGPQGSIPLLADNVVLKNCAS